MPERSHRVAAVVVMTDIERQPLLDGRPVKRSRFSKTRFAAYAGFGLVFIFLFNLVFLPRTSVSRDWRRLHHVSVSLSDIERSLFQSIDPHRIREWSKKYTSERHLAGENYPLVQWTHDKFEEYGIDSKIARYDVYLNKPVDHAVNLLDKHGNVKYSASLEEDEIEEDPTTTLPEDQKVPTFHGYSASGNVTAKFVYANYGLKEDFDKLIDEGVDLKGKVVIVRYNKIFRGLKVKFAQDVGAAAVLIYSDPGDDPVQEKDGYKPYPDGPARNPSAVQRGSVQFLSLLPGDPTTPGYASKPGADREDPSFSIPSIPSIPVSYRDVLPILKQLNGKGLTPKELGDDWAGGLDGFDYSVGPSDLELNVYNLQDYAVRPIYNVIGTIDGVLRDEAIVIGNHRDAWITGGAGDPNSGSAVLIELARAFGELKKLGWKPVRTIILASWDGEEYGLLGSTEWGEDHQKYINHNVLAYINVDVAVSGSEFHVSGSPLLNDLVRKVTARVSSPDGEGSLRDYWAGGKNKVPYISTLGSGSDYTVFQDHIGVPSVDLGFSGGPDTVYQYHSNYDSFHWIDKFADPEWKYHATAAKIWGLLTVTLAEQEVIAIKATEYGELLAKYVESLDDDVTAIARKDSADYDEDVVTDLFGDLKVELQEFIDKAKEFDEYTTQLQHDYIKDYPWYKWYKKVSLLFAIKIANYKLFRLERQFIYKEGLDSRPWFKHVVFAPDLYKGYAGVLLPGLTEAIHDKSVEQVVKWTEIITKAVKSAQHYL